MIHKTIQLTEDPQVTLTTYIQEQSNEMPNSAIKPAILILPGGGYTFCSDREAEPIAIAYMHAGFHAFVLRYSINKQSKFPRPLQDAEAAMNYIKNHATAYGIDPNKIACIGFSAGGHLAASLATSGSIRPNAVILGYPALVRSPKHGWDFPTPVVDQDTPEAFIFHTVEDQVVPDQNALYYAHQMSQAKIPYELHIFRNGTHGLSLGNEFVANDYAPKVEKEYQRWLIMSIDWLNIVLHKPSK